MDKTSSSIQSMKQSLKRLKPIIENIKKAQNIQEKLEILNDPEEISEFLRICPVLKNYLLHCSVEEQYILKSLLILGQGSIIFRGIEEISHPEIFLKALLKNLKPVEGFYDMLGGIIGYHATMLQLILEKVRCNGDEEPLKPKERYLKAPGHDLSKDTPFVRKAIRKSLEKMSMLAEIYPVGGAGDRLKLQDEKTGEDLPSAELLYEGRTLLEGLIRDLQAREYLYYKLFEKQIVIPIAMMTSDEKNNHKHILSICKKHGLFGRKEDSYYFFKQPMVPVLTEEGYWAVSESNQLIFKPGGHGVLWKLALDAGIIDRLIDAGCTKALVRQINNPLAGTDYGLLAFHGCGILSDQLFGFSSCPRLLNTAEGMNVLIEKHLDDGYEYCISNIEYPDFVKKHIKDVSEKPGSPFSAFPANTNILFVDLKAIIKTINNNPVPGMLINMKIKKTCLAPEGEKREIFTGRLESLMQNIADVMTKRFSKPQEHLKPDALPVFLTYNTRRKTISVTKKLYAEGQPIIETPEGCYYDQLLNHYELFTSHCQMELPVMPSETDYIQQGPSFITSFHPALGPLYSVIAQKIQGGKLEYGSEMILEIAEVELRKVELEGSLLIYAENVTGHKDERGLICYSENVGRCVLKNVKIVNQGINRQQTSSYWKAQMVRKEAFKIILRGCSEFIAENVTFIGAVEIEVPDQHRMIARQKEGQVVFILEPISDLTHWKYSFDEEDRIYLSK